jgi:hypothetical protein
VTAIRSIAFEAKETVMERSFKFGLKTAALAASAALALTAAPAAAQTHVDVGVWLPNVGARVVVGAPPPVYVPAPVYAPVYPPAYPVAYPVYGAPYPVYGAYPAYGWGPGKRGRGWGPPRRRAYAAPVYVQRVYVDRYAPRYQSGGRYRDNYRDVRRNQSVRGYQNARGYQSSRSYQNVRDVDNRSRQDFRGGKRDQDRGRGRDNRGRQRR